MARTREEIVADMGQEAQRYEVLSELEENSSRTSVWHYAKQVVGFAIQTLEHMLDHHKKDIENKIRTQESGSAYWYVQKTKEFQYGDQLTVVDNVPRYLVTNKDHRLIKHVSLTEKTDSGTLEIKVVKEDAQGDFVPLSSDEKAALLSYLNHIKFAGTKIEIISREANKIGLHMEMEVDAQVLNLSGTSLLEDNKKPVEEAIHSYLKNLPFDSVLYLSKLEDAIQAVEGIRDVHFIKAVYINESTRQPVAFTRKYLAPAGHLVLDKTQTRLRYTNS